MKKILALILTLSVFATLFAGCGEDKNWLPAEIEFGTTYEEMKENTPDVLFAPAGKFFDLGENDNGATAQITDEQWNAFLSSDVTLGNDVSRYYFDKDEKLYSFSTFCLLENENQLEDLFNALGDYYTNLIGSEPTEKEENFEEIVSTITYDWDTEDIKVNIVATVLGTSCTVKLQVTHPEYSHPE